MPFITEELWQALHDREDEKPAKSIAFTHFPQTVDFHRNDDAEIHFGILTEVVSAVREMRKQATVPEKELLPVLIRTRSENVKRSLTANMDLLAKFARVSEVIIRDEFSSTAYVRHLPQIDVSIEYERKIDVLVERERLSKELERLTKEWDNSQRQLQNETFLAKAPAKVVEGLKTRAAELPGLLEKTQSALSTVEDR